MIKTNQIQFFDAHEIGQLHSNVAYGPTDPNDSGCVLTEMRKIIVISVVYDNVSQFAFAFPRQYLR